MADPILAADLKESNKPLCSLTDWQVILFRFRNDVICEACANPIDEFEAPCKWSRQILPLKFFMESLILAQNERWRRG